MILHRMSPLLVAAALFATPALADPDAPDVVPVAPVKITNPPKGKVDNLFATAPVPNGFVVTWSRSTGSIPPFIVAAQKFTQAGKPAGPPIVVDGPGTVGDVAKPLVIGPNLLALFWLHGGHVWAARLDAATMKVTAKTDLGKSDDHIHDVARLPGGNIAVITAQHDLRNPKDVRYKNSIKVVTPAFKTVRDWISVHGTGFPIDGWAYYDQTVVATAVGGLALYRDHVTGAIVGRKFTSAGALVGSVFPVNTTRMSAISIIDLAYFQVKAVKLGSGKVAACWVSLEATGNQRYEVRCRMLSASGLPLGKDFLAHASTLGAQTAPDLLALPGDRFLVTWVHADNVFPASVRYRAFTSLGNPVYAARTGHAFTAADLSMATLNTEAAFLGDGSVAVVMDQAAFVTGLRGFGIRSPTK